MHPFFHVFGFQIPAFSTMMLTAALVAGIVLFLRARVKNIAWDDLFNLLLIVLGGALAGGFLLNALLKLPEVIQNWSLLTTGRTFLDAVQSVFLALSGLVFYGAFLGGVLAAFLYTRKYKLPFWPVADACAPVIPLAHAIGRIGCLLGGCCFGMPVDAGHPLAIVYPEASLAAPPGIPLLASPLLEAGCNLLLFAALLLIERVRPMKATYGRLFCLYLMAYACERFILEFFRGDLARGFLGPLSTSQTIAIPLFLAGLVLFFLLPSRNSRSVEALKTYRAKIEYQRELAKAYRAAHSRKP